MTFVTIKCKIKEVLWSDFGTCSVYVYVVNFELSHIWPQHRGNVGMAWYECSPHVHNNIHGTIQDTVSMYGNAKVHHNS